jgi:hypothetical protein
MARKRTTFPLLLFVACVGRAAAQDETAAPVLPAPSAVADDGSIGSPSDSETSAGPALGPVLIPPAPAAEPADVPEPAPAHQDDVVPSAAPTVRPPAVREFVVPSRVPRTTQFRPVTPAAPDAGTEYPIDDMVRQATRNLPIDDETRSRYRFRDGEWWFLTSTGTWMYYRDGAWRNFDPLTYRLPAPAAGATGIVTSSYTVPQANEPAGPDAAAPLAVPRYQLVPQPYPVFQAPPGMDRGDVRRALRRARRDGFYGPPWSFYGP